MPGATASETPRTKQGLRLRCLTSAFLFPVPLPESHTAPGTSSRIPQYGTLIQASSMAACWL
ncbi:mCG148423 [Mus musculus]|nr:mCG148423 [Mus musculus]